MCSSFCVLNKEVKHYLKPSGKEDPHPVNVQSFRCALLYCFTLSKNLWVTLVWLRDPPVIFVALHITIILATHVKLSCPIYQQCIRALGLLYKQTRVHVSSVGSFFFLCRLRCAFTSLLHSPPYMWHVKFAKLECVCAALQQSPSRTAHCHEYLPYERWQIAESYHSNAFTKVVLC